MELQYLKHMPELFYADRIEEMYHEQYFIGKLSTLQNVIYSMTLYTLVWYAKYCYLAY